MRTKFWVNTLYVGEFPSDSSKDDPFSGSTTTHSNDPSPSSSPVKTSDNIEKFTDELAPLDSLPPGNDDSTLKKDLHKENFQENVEIKNSNVSDKLVFLNIPLSDKDECFAPEDDNDEIDDFLAIENESSITFSPRSDPLHHEFASKLLTLPSRND
ncbi:hypothetical protein Tco_1496456, partial [Tanacetum coccineum]